MSLVRTGGRRAAKSVLPEVLRALPLVVTICGRHAWAQETLTPELLLADQTVTAGRVSDLHWLPDSKRIVFSISEDEFGDGRHRAWIHMIDVASGRMTILARGTDPKPSPDGTMIAFIEGGAATSSLAILSMPNGRVRRLAPFVRGWSEGYDFGFAWAPDSRRLVYGYRPVARDLDHKDRRAAVLVIGDGKDVPPESEAWLVDVATGASRRLAHGRYLFSSPAWFPDGKSFLFATVGSFEYRNDDVLGRVLSTVVSTGRTRTLLRDVGVQQLRPSIAPGGEQIAFRYDPVNVVYPYYWNVGLLDLTSGRVRQLTTDVFVDAGPIWSPKGDKLYFGCREGPYTQLCTVSMTGSLTQLTRGEYNVARIAVSPDGETLAWLGQDARGSVALRIGPATGVGEPKTIDLSHPRADYALGSVERVSWLSRDGLSLVGLLIKPPTLRSNKKYPLLVSLHGGPVGGIYLRGEILMNSPLEWHMWAARDFLVFVPDYRESLIYGWAPLLRAREQQDIMARNMDDVMSGVDHVIREGIVDTARMAVMGHSYGSVLTNWIITHTHRFGVAVSYEGWADLSLLYGSGLRVGGNAFCEWMYGGKPWEVPANYRRNSALEYVRGVKTPTLFVNGDYGGGGGSGVEFVAHHELMYTALTKQGVDSKLLIYRGEGHVMSKPENRRDLLIRAIAWIEHHLGLVN